MRVFLRITLVTTLITIAVLAAWSLVQRSASTGAASAASALQVPRYCIPPELAGIRSLLARTTDPAARRALQAKQTAAEQAARACAANATARPPAPKSANAGPLPTQIPAATPTMPAGIQHAELLPVGDFLPAEAGNNTWAGVVDGHALEVFAGSLLDANGNWQAEHPDWVARPELHVQGALRVIVDGDGLKATEYPTASRHGALHLVDACGSTLVLQAADGTLFAFDISTLQYQNPAPSCPAPTP